MFILDKELPQGSSEWLEWRRAGIGGSTVYGLACHAQTISEVDESLLAAVKPSDMSEVPEWVPTPRQIYREYFGQPREVSRFHTERGHRLEPVARDLFSESLGETVVQACVFPEQLPECRVSLDGYAPNARALLEVKAPYVAWKHLPDYVIWQTAYQAAVCIAAGISVESVLVAEIGDVEAQLSVRKWDPVQAAGGWDAFLFLGEALMELASLFYNRHLAEASAPEYTSTELREITPDFPQYAEFEERADAWKAAKQALDVAKDAEQAAREALLETIQPLFQGLAGVIGDGLSARKTDAAGAVDYKIAAIALLPEDTDYTPYRRVGTSRITLRVQ